MICVCLSARWLYSLLSGPFLCSVRRGDPSALSVPDDMATRLREHGGVSAELVQRAFLRLRDRGYRRRVAQSHHLRGIQVQY